MWVKSLGFDTDGVIVNADELHYKAFNQCLSQENIQPIGKKEYYKKYLSNDDKGFFRDYLYELRRQYPSNDEINELVDKKAKIFQELMLNDPPSFYPGVVKSIKKMKSLGIKLFDVTGSLHEETMQHFKRAGIEECFDFIITAEDVEKHKPHPESYLKALEKLTELHIIKPSESSSCFVTEDSEGGIKSAKGAGFSVIGLTNTTDAENLWKAGADIVINKVDPRLYEKITKINKTDSRLELITSIFYTYGDLSKYVKRADRKYYLNYIEKERTEKLDHPTSFLKELSNIIANKSIPVIQ
jgi:HAD superfamily hydrolase (TIGR01509 family)